VEAADRVALGHWEGDLIPGFRSSSSGAFVERTTRFTLLRRPHESAQYASADYRKIVQSSGFQISISRNAD
jgi:IS30 family transposase